MLKNIATPIKEKEGATFLLRVKWKRIPKSVFIGVCPIVEAILIYACFNPVITLNESQVLYLASTCAQVVATLFGLTITGYVFIDSKLKLEADEDESLVDIVRGLKNHYRKFLILLGTMTVSTILLLAISMTFCISGVLFHPIVNNVVLTNGLVFFFLSLLMIIGFMVEAIDPDKIEQFSTNAHKKLFNGGNDVEGDLAEFLKTYNAIEQIVIEKSSALPEPLTSKRGSRRERRQGMFTSLRVLKQHGILSPELFNELDELRRYRNYLIHGYDSEKAVSLEACIQAKTTLKNLEISFSSNNKLP